MRYFSESELKDLLLQVARGLKYIHSMSLVHMDIKPSKYSMVWYFLKYLLFLMAEHFVTNVVLIFGLFLQNYVC